MIHSLIRENNRFGQLRCWNYMEEDGNDNLAKENLDG